MSTNENENNNDSTLTSSDITRAVDSTVPSTVSSGYESEGVSLPSDPQVYRGMVSYPPHILQAPSYINPLILHQPPPSSSAAALGYNNSQPIQTAEQYYSMLPTAGQPYTAPIMIATREQMDYAVAQQINEQSHDDQLSHDRQPVYQYRPYSGPIHLTNAHQPPPISDNNSMKGASSGNNPPLIIPQNVYQLPYNNNGSGVGGGMGGNVVIMNSSSAQPNPVSAHPPMKVTQSLNNFTDYKSPKPLRRSTLPDVDMPKTNRKEMYRRSAMSLKEKSLCEEGTWVGG